MDDGQQLPIETRIIDFTPDPSTTSSASTTTPFLTPTATFNPGNYKGGVFHNSTHRHYRHGENLNDPARWKVPTILALTIAIGLGTALAIFLAVIAWRRVRKLRELRRQDAAMREIGQ